MASPSESSKMAESLVVSPVNYKNKGKDAYLRMKNCSPKFRSLLRQRYRERIENSRYQLLSRLRHIDAENNIETKTKSHTEDVHLDSVTYRCTLLEDEWQNSEDWNLDKELLLEESLQEELTQYENWLLQEYELMWNEEESKSDEVTVICPLCYSGRFEFSHHNKIICRTCCSSFTTQRSMLEIESDIFSEVDKHKIQCSSDPVFVNIPGYETHNNLCIVCDMCSYLQIVI